MAAQVVNAVNIVDSTEEDDEVLVVYATPAPTKKGTSKIDAISVEDYNPKSKRIIDLTKPQSSRYAEDDEVKILHSLPKSKRHFKGECSGSKSAGAAIARFEIPLTSMCDICADEKPRSYMFPIMGCNHSLCSECTKKYVASKLQENITAINCPYPGCNGRLEPYHCRQVLPEQVFERWGDALCEALILGSERFYCPFKDCSALLIDDSESEGILQAECPNCNRLFCAGCKVAWHSGIECAEFQKLSKDERENEDIMLMNLAKERKWTRCANCGFYVEKKDGCLFMICRCGYTFCYNCGAPLKDHYCDRCKS